MPTSKCSPPMSTGSGGGYDGEEDVVQADDGEDVRQSADAEEDFDQVEQADRLVEPAGEHDRDAAAQRHRHGHPFR